MYLAFAFLGTCNSIGVWFWGGRESSRELRYKSHKITDDDIMSKLPMLECQFR
jgi:hypothetical protein